MRPSTCLPFRHSLAHFVEGTHPHLCLPLTGRASGALPRTRNVAPLSDQLLTISLFLLSLLTIQAC